MSRARRPPLSDRKRDAFDSPAKMGSRDRNLLAVVSQAHELWDVDNHLRGSWAELMGETGLFTLDMLEKAKALLPSQFIGIDTDAERVRRFAAARPDCRWIQGDLLDSLRRPELEDVVVLNFDAYEAVGGPKVTAIARNLRPLARRAALRFGAFVLFLNADLDAVRLQGRAYGEALRSHARALAETLAHAGHPRRVLTEEALLPDGAERAVDERAFTGQVGAFEVYRGKATGHRMANLRLILR